MSPYPKPSPQGPFVYGTFLWPGRKKTSGFSGLIEQGEPDVAVEILREFSASEFVGKLYTRSPSRNWAIAQVAQIEQAPWYVAFNKNPQLFVFDLQRSGPWQVLYFRTESDESGNYVAIGLRQFEKAPLWVKTVRQFVFGSESP